MLLTNIIECDMKKSVFLFVFMIFGTIANAQLVIGKSSGQVILEKAIYSSMIVVKQSYQVKHLKTGKIYGRSGRKEFGHSFSIAVKSEAGFILTEEGLKPWLYDESFKKVENDYEPVISMTEIRGINTDSKFMQCPMKIKGQQPAEGIWIANIVDSLNDNKLEIDNEDGLKDGWLIWFYSPKDSKADELGAVSLQSFNKKIDIRKGISIDIDEPTNKNQVLGGIYVCPYFIGGGHVVYKLVGMAMKIENKWKLQIPFVGISHENSSVEPDEKPQEEPNVEEPAQEKDDQDIDLTPVEQPKDKKKGKKSKK